MKKPFKNVDEFVNWKMRNCNQCTFSNNKNSGRYGALEMLKKVDQGLECSLKYAVQQSFTGPGLDEVVAEEIGVKKSGKMPYHCRSFMPRPKEESKPTAIEIVKRMLRKKVVSV